MCALAFGAFAITLTVMWCVIPGLVIATSGWDPRPLLFAYLMTGVMTAGWFVYMTGRDPHRFKGYADNTRVKAVIVMLFGWPYWWVQLARQYLERMP